MSEERFGLYELIKQKREENLNSLLEYITPRQRKIFIGRFYNNIPWSKLGKEFDISGTQAQNVYNWACRHIVDLLFSEESKCKKKK